MTDKNLAHTTDYHDDEIDLVELISNLWKEKWVIVICTFIVSALGLTYLFTVEPTYEAVTQIQAPRPSTLAPFESTQLIKVEPQTAFSQLLNILESDAHKSYLIYAEKNKIATLYGINEDDISPERINTNNLYTIRYPNLKKQENSLEPDIYTLKTEGTDRQLIKELLDSTINLATEQLLDKWHNEFDKIKKEKINKFESNLSRQLEITKERRKNKITTLTEETDLQIKNISDDLTARKTIVLNIRKNRIIQLQEALKIANSLNLVEPSSLSRLANNASQRQAEINTEINTKEEPLYLRGAKLLSAELESLKKLPRTTFLDSKVIELRARLQKVKNNREIEILKNRENDIPFDQELQKLSEELVIIRSQEFPDNLNIQFQNTLANASERPIKPKKMLILAISILLGGMIGFFVAIGRIIYKNSKLKH